MNEIEFLFIGWCKGTGRDGVQHDKVWTAFKVGDVYYAGWGARDKKIRFKKHASKRSLETLMRNKKKTYDEVDSFRLFTIFPYFKEDVEKHLTFDLMANRVMPA